MKRVPAISYAENPFFSPVAVHKNRLRWGACALIALFIHGLLFAWLCYRRSDRVPNFEVPPPALMIVLANSEQSVQQQQKLPPGPQQTLSMPQQQAKPETQDQPHVEQAKSGTLARVEPKHRVAEHAKPTRAKPKPQPITDSKSPPADTPPAPATSAPPALPGKQIAAPQNSDSNAAANDRMNWSSLLLGHLSRYKRYPTSAAHQQRQGVVYIRVTLDRQGNVKSVQMTRSSDTVALDNEAIQLPQRASPVPPPPDSLSPGQPQITVTIPIRFDLREARH